MTTERRDAGIDRAWQSILRGDVPGHRKSCVCVKCENLVRIILIRYRAEVLEEAIALISAREQKIPRSHPKSRNNAALLRIMMAALRALAARGETP